MKNRAGIVIFFIVVGIVIASIIYILTKYESYIFQIYKVDGNYIVGEIKLIGDYTYREEANIIEINGNTIKKEEFKIGNSFVDERTNYSYKILQIGESNNCKLMHSEYYRMYLDNNIITDIDGNVIDISNIEVGDTIYVVNKINNDKIDLAYTMDGYPLNVLDEVVKIKTLDKVKE